MDKYDKTIKARFHSRETAQIDYIVGLLDDKYANRSHFLRCAVLQLIRLELLRLKDSGVSVPKKDYDMVPKWTGS